MCLSFFYNIIHYCCIKNEYEKLDITETINKDNTIEITYTSSNSTINSDNTVNTTDSTFNTTDSTFNSDEYEKIYEDDFIKNDFF